MGAAEACPATREQFPRGLLGPIPADPAQFDELEDEPCGNLDAAAMRAAWQTDNPDAPAHAQDDVPAAGPAPPGSGCATSRPRSCAQTWEWLLLALLSLLRRPLPT